MKHPFINAGLLALTALASAGADAITINITDATPTYTASIPTCSGGAYSSCTSTAHLWTDSLADNTNFNIDDAFNAWNATNPANQQWTLAQGGALPGGVFNVSTFDAFAEDAGGGLKIQVDWTYNGADKSDFVWVQGLWDNYLLNGNIVNPFYEMDINNTGCTNTGVWDTNGNRRCAPAYPYQYADRYFYDRPRAPWPNAFFDADAYLSKVDYTTRTLTLYEGVHYGFNLSANAVPVPAAVWLFVSGLMGLLGIGRCRRA